MNSNQIALVQNTWAKVKPISETAADLFYGRLFEIDPSTRELFKADMKEQGQRLMAMIDTAVSNLTQLETVVPAVQDLGKRHAGYGVRDAQYDSVGSALLWTLGQGLGEDFTSDAKEAWTLAYGTLAGVMKEAAAKVA